MLRGVVLRRITTFLTDLYSDMDRTTFKLDDAASELPLGLE